MPYALPVDAAPILSDPGSLVVTFAFLFSSGHLRLAVINRGNGLLGSGARLGYLDIDWPSLSG